MMRRVLGAMLLISIAQGVLLAQETDAPPSMEYRVPQLAERLSALRPEDPMGYFELGEEVASEIPTAQGMMLARRLFVLAHESDRALSRPRGIAASVYLALAEIAEDPSERAWLMALAGSGRGFGLTSGDRMEAASIPSADAVALAEAISFARDKDGREVKELLRRDGVYRLYAQRQVSFGDVRTQMVLAQEQVSCQSCRNRRTVRGPGGGSNAENALICPICGGNPGLKLTAPQLADSLAAESELVGASHESWSAQVWLDGGAVLHDPDADELAALFKVDPIKNRWKPGDTADPLSGRWVDSVDAE